MASRFRGTTAVALVTMLASGLPSLAQAAPSDQRAALLPLQVEGDFNEGWREQMEQELERGLVQSGLEVVAPQQVLEASGGVGTCANAKCFVFLSSSVDARFLVRSKIAVEERNYEVSIDIIDGVDGSLAASSNESCQLCGLAEVGDLVAKQSAALRQKVDVLALEPAVVVVTSEPAGAMVSIDGEPVGEAPVERELAPGEHHLLAHLDGYADQSRSVGVVQGVRETVHFELLAATKRQASKDWKVPTGWTLFAVGVAGVAAGATFLAIDEDPYKSQCSGPDVDAFGNCRQRYDTLWHGVGFTAAGGALLVTGAALLIAARVKRGRGKKVDATARRLRLGPTALGVRF